MRINIGFYDRVARIVIGVAVLSLFFVLEGSARWLGALGLVALATAALGSCPLYSLLGLDTRFRGDGRRAAR